MTGDPPKRPRRLMKAREVAHLFNVEPQTVIDWAKAGEIPSLRTPGGQYRFRPADVEALLLTNDDTRNDNGPALAIAAPGEPLTAPLA